MISGFIDGETVRLCREEHFGRLRAAQTPRVNQGRGGPLGAVRKGFRDFSSLFSSDCAMHMRNLNFSTLTWDRTRAPAVETWSLNHWTAREVLSFSSNPGLLC